jgi:hypothetical protein
MDAAAIPTEMVPLVSGFCRAVARLTQQEVDAPLAVLEERLVSAVREELLPVVMGHLIRRTQRSLWPGRRRSAWPCPQCAAPQTIQSWRTRTLRTTCGTVRYERPWCACRRCHRGFSPTDHTLRVEPGQRLSPALRQQVAHLGAATSFVEASGLLATFTGIALPHETVRRITEEVGKQVEAETAAAVEHVAVHREPVALAPVPGRLVVEADGVMVPYRDGWHEVKVGVVGGWSHGTLRAVSYTAARLSAEHFGPRLLAEAARRGALAVAGWTGGVRQRGLAHLRPVTVVGDGAHWIWDLAATHFGERTEVVDWYHASQHVWAVAHALHPEDRRAARWATQRCRSLWERGPAPLVRALRRAKPATPGAAEVLRREAGYFRTNAARMAYPALRSAQQPMGSGAVESAAKHLVQQRLKRAGCRWSDPGAAAVLALRCRLLSAA